MREKLKRHRWVYRDDGEIFPERSRYCVRCCTKEKIQSDLFFTYLLQWMFYFKPSKRFELLEECILRLSEFFGHFGICKEPIVLYIDEEIKKY